MSLETQNKRKTLNPFESDEDDQPLPKQVFSIVDFFESDAPQEKSKRVVTGMPSILENPEEENLQTPSINYGIQV
jgi:hypothetical protein